MDHHRPRNPTKSNHVCTTPTNKTKHPNMQAGRCGFWRLISRECGSGCLSDHCGCWILSKKGGLPAGPELTSST
eukprot:678141-Rhodomonas_salina.3